MSCNCLHSTQLFLNITITMAEMLSYCILYIIKFCHPAEYYCRLELELGFQTWFPRIVRHYWSHVYDFDHFIWFSPVKTRPPTLLSEKVRDCLSRRMALFWLAGVLAEKEVLDTEEETWRRPPKLCSSESNSTCSRQWHTMHPATISTMFTKEYIQVF